VPFFLTTWFAVDWRCDLEFPPDHFPDPEGLCRDLAADGTPAERMRNQYPVRYQAAVHAATAAARGEGERIAWNRAGWAGAQRFPVHRGGDVPPAWEMLLPQLHGGLSLGLSGSASGRPTSATSPVRRLDPGRAAVRAG
jgi:Glycosyl hydrolases family 31